MEQQGPSGSGFWGFRGLFKVEDPETLEFASKCASGVLTRADARHLPELRMLALLNGANPRIVARLALPAKTPA